MKISNIINKAYRRCGLSGTLVFTVIVLMSSPAFGMNQVGLYDVWETKVTNSNSYSNPFDFNVIELRATFTSPSGSKINFFGFYDGNGNGGQTGNVWKLRFMPDRVGTWRYTYSWTDGTPGGSGSFNVSDTGLPGPLKVGTDNSWFFMDSRGKPFDFRGYDIHGFHPSSNQSFAADARSAVTFVKNTLASKGYNFTMFDGAIARNGLWRWSDSWWLGNDVKRFNIGVWTAFDELFRAMSAQHIYAMNFAGMIAQTQEYGFADFKVFLRYWVARFAPYYNYLGWSPTWEWTDIWSASQVHQIMNQVEAWDPFPRLLSVHDCSDSSFSGWLDFSMRQNQSRTIFDGNARQATNWGVSSSRCDAPRGDVGNKFVNKPIIGSEDIWEGTLLGMPRNGTEVRRAAWGIMMAGVMPLYSEWHSWTQNPGNLAGEAEVRRMFDFFYSKTQYRKYTQMNNLVSSSARQIASGKAGLEYLVYDDNGGSITINLSGAGGSNTFNVLWYNPTSGATQNGGKVNGGASRTLNSPFSGDTVLLLTKGVPDKAAPKAPRGLTLTNN